MMPKCKAAPRRVIASPDATCFRSMLPRPKGGKRSNPSNENLNVISVLFLLRCQIAK